MTRILSIEADRSLAQTVGRACLEKGIAVGIAENLCEGIRFLLDGPVSAVLVDASLLRLPGVDQVKLFDAGTPGVPVVVLIGEKVSLPERVRYQILGFHPFSKSSPVEDLLEKAEALALAASIGRERASQDWSILR